MNPQMLAIADSCDLRVNKPGAGQSSSRSSSQLEAEENEAVPVTSDQYVESIEIIPYEIKPDAATIDDQNDATEHADKLSDTSESQEYKSEDGEQTVAGQQECAINVQQGEDAPLENDLMTQEGQAQQEEDDHYSQDEEEE